MKKILSIALVALITVSSAFAGFTGSASLGFGFDFDKGEYGFNNSKALAVTFNLTSGQYPAPVVEEEAAEDAAEAEEVEEAPAPSVVAGIEGSFSLDLKEFKSVSKNTAVSVHLFQPKLFQKNNQYSCSPR